MSGAATDPGSAPIADAGRARAILPVLLFVLAAGLLFAKLGRVPLANFDDCYYAEKAKEMVRGGDWLTPHFAGIPRVDNPPLFLWLMALAFLVAGVHNAAAIFWSALSGALCVPALYLLARRLRWSVFEAWSAALVLLGTQYFFKYARHAMFDVFVTLLFLLAMVGYVRGAQGDRKWLLLLGASAGLGILTKSVLGLFPIAVSAAHLAWTGRWGLLRDRWLVAAVALAALISIPWYAAQFALHRDLLLEEHVRWLLLKRGLGDSDRPWWSYLDYLRELVAVYWPWLPLALAGAWITLRRALRGRGGSGAPAEGLDATSDAAGAFSERDTARLLLLWFGVVVGTLSLAAEKKLWYIMPAFPCLALLAATAAGAWIQDESRRRVIMVAGHAVLAAAAIALWALPIPLGKDRQPELHRMALAARDLVPRDQVLANLDLPYWSTVNHFLFYSDHPITEPLGDPEAVRVRLRAGDFALLTDEGAARVMDRDRAAYVVADSAGDFRLVRAARPGEPAAATTGK